MSSLPHLSRRDWLRLSTAGVVGQDPQRQLKNPAHQQRQRGKQPDLPVAQPQVMPDERQRRALDAVGKLVGHLDREPDGQRGYRRLSASIEIHVTHGKRLRMQGKGRATAHVSGDSRGARPGAGRTSPGR